MRNWLSVPMRISDFTWMHASLVKLPSWYSSTKDSFFHSLPAFDVPLSSERIRVSFPVRFI